MNDLKNLSLNSRGSFMFFQIFLFSFLLFHHPSFAVLTQDETYEVKKSFEKIKRESVLVIDGGGVRGIIAVCTLKRISDLLSQRLRDKIRTYTALTSSGKKDDAKKELSIYYQELLDEQYHVKLNKIFGTIAGTSTGSIVAAGVAVGKSPAELEEIYLTKSFRIFPKMYWPHSGNFFHDLTSCCYYPLKNTFFRIMRRLTFGCGEECTSCESICWSGTCCTMGLCLGEPLACLDHPVNCCGSCFSCCSQGLGENPPWWQMPCSWISRGGEHLCGLLHAVTGLFPQLCYPSYHTGPLRQELQQALGDATFQDTYESNQTHLQITSYNLKTDKLVYFNKIETPELKIRKAVRFSSAAPTYFEGSKDPEHPDKSIDGGVADNSPLLAALSLRSNFSAEDIVKDILVLSIGTGREYKDRTSYVASGLLRLIKPLLMMAMDGLGESNNIQLERVLRDRMCRIQPELSGDLLTLDAAENIGKLKEFIESYLDGEKVKRKIDCFLTQLPGGDVFEGKLLDDFPDYYLDPGEC